MSDLDISPDPQNRTANPPVIRVLGIGGAGGNLVKAMPPAMVPGLSCCILNTDQQALKAQANAPTVALGRTVTFGLSAGGDPKLGRAAAEADEQPLSELCRGADLVFILAGMGGGTGGGAAPVAARVAKASGALVLAVATLPFEFEGGRRQRQANLALVRLRQEADAVIAFPNQQIFQFADASTPLSELLDRANRLLAEGALGLARALACPGIVNLDFGVLRSTLAGRHAESCLAAAEADGENRAFEVWNRLEGHPAFGGTRILPEADSLVVSFIAGPDLVAAEVEWIMEQFKAKAPNARLTFGAAQQNELAGRLAVTVVASRFGEAVEEPAAPPPASSQTAPRTDSPPPEMGTELLQQDTPRPRSRFVAPAPILTADRARQLYRRQSSRPRKKKSASLQTLLPLEIVSKGRFEKSEPTIYDGEDLDVPTYIRRGVILN